MSLGSAAPSNGRGGGKVAGMGEGRHHDDVTRFDLVIVNGGVEVDGYADTKQVAASVKRVAVSLTRNSKHLRPIPEEKLAGLVGNQQVEVG
jgi:hypothetical protein